MEKYLFNTFRPSYPYESQVTSYALCHQSAWKDKTKPGHPKPGSSIPAACLTGENRSIQHIFCFQQFPNLQLQIHTCQARTRKKDSSQLLVLASLTAQRLEDILLLASPSVPASLISPSATIRRQKGCHLSKQEPSAISAWHASKRLS